MSIYIENFSIPLQQEVYFTDLVSFSAEIKDDVYIVVSSGVGIYVNEKAVPFIQETINNGYKLTYNIKPTSNFDITYSGINNINESIKKTYNMFFGYTVLSNEVNYWEVYKEVPVFIKVSNNVTSVGTSYFSTFFETRKYKEATLEATITADGSGYKDLNTLLRAQSTYFFYGKTYTITITGIKDFSGNIMPDKKFIFTIEDKN
jgi:hypothetical protein